MDLGPAAAAPSISALELNDWISWQTDHLDAWQAKTDDAWLSIASGNPAFPDIAALLFHAFTPLHRYSDKILGAEPVAPEMPKQLTWPQHLAWARTCLDRHREACHAALDGPEREIQFQTRSAGILAISARLALVHAATHCLWHLSGISHLLRQAGIAPAQRSDLIFWALEQK